MAEEVSEEDIKLLQAFHSLHVQPKVEKTEDLLQLIRKIGKELEQEQAVKQEPTSTGRTSGSHHFSKISTFYGEAGKGEVRF